MKILDLLDKKFGKHSIQNITYYLIAGQVIAFLLISLRPDSLGKFNLVGSLVKITRINRIHYFVNTLSVN